MATPVSDERGYGKIESKRTAKHRLAPTPKINIAASCPTAAQGKIGNFWRSVLLGEFRE
jgi:hypothetical protein